MTAPDDRFDAEAERAADAADLNAAGLMPCDEDAMDKRIWDFGGEW